MEKLNRQRANAASLTDALGWTSILQAFAGKKSKPIHYSEFLPYRDEFDEGDRTLSRWAVSICADLINKDALPIQLVRTLADIKEVGKEIK